MNWIERAKTDIGLKNQTLSFNEYMNYFEKNALRELRPSYHYLVDMLQYFQKENQDHFNLFLMEDSECPPVFGQYGPQKLLYDNLLNFSEEGINNKFILLVGPNGSSKSSLIKKLMRGVDLYSETDEGSLYSFNWVFPNDSYLKGSLGLGHEKVTQKVPSFAHLSDKNIAAILPSELKDHPLLLIPLKFRQEIIYKHLKDDPKKWESIRKSYLFKGDLSKRNRMIYNALLSDYKGDHEQVLKHIRVERFNLSRRYSVGAVTIEPQLHVDASIQQITMDRRLQSLPPSLQSLNLFSLKGEVILANRGILEFSDLLKRPLDTFKYLLMTVETGTINLQGILTELDIFFVGTSNEVHLSGFKQHPDFNSFKGRFNFIKVPYLLDYLEEEKIYQGQIKGLRPKAIFEPNALRILCLFAVMTRLRACQARNYPNHVLQKIAIRLNPLEKALLLSHKISFPKLELEEKQVLENGLLSIRNEFINESLYEGKFGLSPRDLKKIIYQLSSKEENITFFSVLNFLETLILEKNEYDFLNMTPQGDFHNAPRFLGLLKEYALELFDYQLRDSLGMVDQRSYEDYLKKYITHINAMTKREKVYNTITGKYQEYDEYFIKEFENNINLKEVPTKFRSFLLSKLGAYALDNPGGAIVYSQVFPDIVHKLKESFRDEQKKSIQTLGTNLVYYEQEQRENTRIDSLSEKDRKQISLIFENLINKFGHSEKGASVNIKILLKENY